MKTLTSPTLFFYFIVFLCSSIFALGLQISGMTNPQKVLGFLDISNNWDPSLALVLLSALVVFSCGFKILVKPRVSKQLPSFLGADYQLPTALKVDKPLIIGASIFGIGWGLAGICPGPAIANIVSFDFKVLAFVATMLIGIKTSQLFTNK